RCGATGGRSSRSRGFPRKGSLRGRAPASGSRAALPSRRAGDTRWLSARRLSPPWSFPATPPWHPHDGLPVRVPRRSPRLDRRDILARREERRRRPSRPLRRQHGKLFHLIPLEADDRLADPAVLADENQRRDDLEAERFGRLPGLGVVESRNPDLEEFGEAGRVLRIVLGHADDRKRSSLGALADAVEERPGELGGGTGRLEETVEG